MSNRILSYRNLIAKDAMDIILLSTKKGEVGYRIVKFELMLPSIEVNAKSLVKIYTDETESALAYDTIDFSQTTLLAAAMISAKSDQTAYPEDLKVIFDQQIFNQDIYITCHDGQGGSSNSINYYLELEVIKLSEDEAMVATLKDIRNSS